MFVIIFLLPDTIIGTYQGYNYDKKDSQFFMQPAI